jgi:Ca2+-binding RTX toxin-like protein
MSWILAAGFENLTIRNDFSESGFTGIGNDLDNVMSVTFASVRLDGRGGNDTLRGSGNQHGDLLLGGDGNDSLVAASGDDGLDGGAGDDTLMGGGDLDTLTGGTGADSFIFDVRPGVSGLDADVVTDFTSGIDRIRLDARVMPELGASGTLTADDPRFFAAPGAAAGHDADDRLVYDTSSGQLYFDPDGSGAETAGLIATLAGPLAATDITIDNGTAPGGQVIQGTSGNDSLTGTPGNDTMNGGLGDDTYIVTAGDVLTDAGGVDTVLSPVAWTLADSFENLTATGTAEVNLTGNNAANVLTGNAVHNFFNPRGGNDTIQGGGGDDWVRLGGGGVPSYGTKVIDLGAGLDSLDFGGFARSAIVVDLAAGTLSGGGEAGAGSATLISIEQVIGDGFNDQLSGSAAAETLNGGAGNDTLSGMGGNDTLIGGTGQDTFLFAAAPGAGNADLVSDFVSGTDKLSFDNSVFTALGADGNFVAGDARFAAGAGFTSGGDASDRIVYDTSSGNLYYDADGSGAGAALLVATLQGHPAIAATDITVI